MKLFKQTAMALACTFLVVTASAQVSTNTNFEITPYADVIFGAFHSEKSYTNPEDHHPSKSWQELGAKYGLKGSANLGQYGLYGSAIAISTATFGDGDAGNVTNGNERRTNLGEWSLGLKDTTGQQDYAKYNVAIGRQNIIIGDGFIVSGDAVNLGQAIAEGALDRGGAYYLAPRKAFDFTSSVYYRPWEQLTTQLHYLKSDNKAQYTTEVLASDVMYQTERLGVGGTYLGVIGLDDDLHETSRHHLKNYALRANYQVSPSLQVEGEYVYQDNDRSNEHAGYVLFSYQFADAAYQPALSYRYSRFSDHYDAMFYGNTTGPGGWVQGEVAGNYAGPNNRNTDIHQLSFSISPKENLMFGAMAYRFETINKIEQNLGAYELDLYSVWSINKHVNVIPLMGLYKPDQDIAMGGSQFPDRDLNVYTQLLLQYTY